MTNFVYLFSWDEIPGNDNRRLIEFLGQEYGIDWVKKAKIKKIDNVNTIKVSAKKNYLSLRLNDEKTGVDLEIDDSRTDKFIVKTENGKLNIYVPDYFKERISSAVSSLKEIVTIVSGVTITHAIIVLVSKNAYLNDNTLTGILTNPDNSLFYFLLLIFNIIRFYHGNMMHLDKTFLRSRAYSSTDGRQRDLGLDFFVIFGESVLFAIMSFYLHSPSEFFILFGGLLIIDGFWSFLNLTQASDPKEFRHLKIWGLLNTSAFILILIIKYSIVNDYKYYIFILIITVATILDFILNWKLYFPKPWNQTSKGGEVRA